MKLAQNVAASILGIFNIGFVWGEFSVSTHTSADDWGWLDCTKKKEKNLDKCTLSCQFRLMRLEFTFQSSLSFSHIDSIKFFWLTCCHQDGNFTCPVHYDFSFFYFVEMNMAQQVLSHQGVHYWSLPNLAYLLYSWKYQIKIIFTIIIVKNIMMIIILMMIIL